MWPKIIDEMIAGLPTNSAQRLELEKLRLKSADDDARIKKLEAQLAALQPKQDGLEVDTVKVLKLFFDNTGGLSSDMVAAHLGMSGSVASYHFDCLGKKSFIVPSSWGQFGQPPRWLITSEGRAFVMKNGLA